MSGHESSAVAVVIGAGIAGVAAAAAIARRHPGEVVLVEQEPLPAQHASGRSASVLSETSGHPVVCALARLSRPWFENPPRDVVEHDLLSPRGLVWVGGAGDEAALDALALAGFAVRDSVRRLDPTEVAALLPAFRSEAIAAGGVHEPDAMAIDTAAVIDAFLRILRHHGGRVLTSHEAVRLQRLDSATDAGDDAPRWAVTVGTTTLLTRHVVDAAGAWADVVATRAGLEPLGLEARRRTAALVPVSDDVSGWPLVMDIASRYYCEPETGGLLISPADETLSPPCDAQADEIDVAIALERVAEATGLPLRSVRRAWAGLRTFAPDRVPVIGEEPDAPGFWWLAGQGGAGIKTAPAMADLLARLLDGEGMTADETALGLSPELLSPARLRRAR